MSAPSPPIPVPYPSRLLREYVQLDLTLSHLHFVPEWELRKYMGFVMANGLVQLLHWNQCMIRWPNLFKAALAYYIIKHEIPQPNLTHKQSEYHNKFKDMLNPKISNLKRELGKKWKEGLTARQLHSYKAWKDLLTVLQTRGQLC